MKWTARIAAYLARAMDQWNFLCKAFRDLPGNDEMRRLLGSFSL
jgi:hypothetical protein